MNHYFNQLTQGAIGHILGGVQIDEPILQMLAYKNMPTENNKRYRLVLSDGAYTYQCCIIMGDLATKVESGEFDRYCLLKVSRYMLNEIQGRQVIVIAEPTLLVRGSQVGEKLGDPVAFGAEGAPPLSNFRPNYHLFPKKNMSMDVEFENDPFDDIDDSSKNKSVSNTNANKKLKNERGQVSARSSNNSANLLNSNLACPIGSLTPYSNNWIIKGRVLSKTNVRTWNNARGEGSLFAFEIKDESGNIRLTAFKNECEKFFDLIKVNEVFLISRGVIKQANKQFNQTGADYEISLNQETIIEPCNDASGCPQVEYDFKPLDTMQNHFGGFVDICAIVKEIQNVEKILRKTDQKELFKRTVVIVDQSKSQIELALWGEMATDLKLELEDVIVIRRAKVTEYNNVSLSITTNSTVEVNPMIDEAHTLKGWYNRVKNNLELTNLTEKRTGVFKAEWKNLSEITPENIIDDAGFALQTKAMIYQIGKTNMYKAGICGCKKKLVEVSDGIYRCDKCGKESDQFEWKIILSLAIADHTKNLWAQCFHEESVKILGDRDIKEIGEIYEKGSAEFDEILRSANFTSYIFKLKCKIEHFNDDSRLRTQVAGIAPVDYREYGSYLISKIREIQ